MTVSIAAASRACAAGTGEISSVAEENYWRMRERKMCKCDFVPYPCSPLLERLFLRRRPTCGCSRTCCRGWSTSVPFRNRLTFSIFYFSSIFRENFHTRLSRFFRTSSFDTGKSLERKPTGRYKNGKTSLIGFHSIGHRTSWQTFNFSLITTQWKISSQSLLFLLVMFGILGKIQVRISACAECHTKGAFQRERVRESEVLYMCLFAPKRTRRKFFTTKFFNENSTQTTVAVTC